MKKIICSLLILAFLVTQSHAQEQAAVEAAVVRAVGKQLIKAGAWIIGLSATAGFAAALTHNTKQNEAAYALQFQIDTKAIRWERIFGWPNVFPFVEVDGRWQYVVPEIFYNYRGGTIVWVFKLPKIPTGSSINVSILDDHSDNNQTWGNILAQRSVTQINSQTSMTRGIEASRSYIGTLELSSLYPPITITGPKSLCKYSVICPSPIQGSHEWHTEGSLINGANSEVGTIRLSQIASW